MELWQSVVIPLLTSLIACSGLWGIINKQIDRKNYELQIIKGLAHDVIITKGMEYINRGYITKDEYEDFNNYLYAPYEKLGGNGLAEKIMDEVKKLPLHTN